MAEGKVLFDRFKVLRLLGRGGIGSVYLVEDISKGNERVALKLVELPPEGRDAFDLIQSEFEVLAKYRHPHLARAFEIGREGSQAYFLMEYFAGSNLLEAAGRENLPEILHLAVQVLRALAFVHGLGFVHGDLKPQNILVEEGGGRPSAKLLDFGLVESVLERDGTPADSSGTPAYLAPERGIGAPADPRSDLYSFGVTLFQVLSGSLPFQGSCAGEIAEKHRMHPPPAPSELNPAVPPELDSVCLKLLEKEPRKRYQSAEAVISALAPHVPGLQPDLPHQAGMHLIMAAFVGREGSLARLSEALEPSLNGSTPPAGAAVMGTEGIGKKRLVREFVLDAMVRGVRVVETECAPDDRHPWDPVLKMVRHLESWVESVDPALRDIIRRIREGEVRLEEEAEIHAHAFQLAKRLKAVFDSASKSTPLLLVCRDIHRAGAGLMELLGRLVGRDGEGRWALLLTGREGFDNPGGKRSFRNMKERGALTVLRLEPLG
ncbi:MAG: serine/threonine-protein kinase, partial [Planctomycetota bacterium]